MSDDNRFSFDEVMVGLTHILLQMNSNLEKHGISVRDETVADLRRGVGGLASNLRGFLTMYTSVLEENAPTPGTQSPALKVIEGGKPED